ncbi:hypothetical protein BGZ63DRAFT_464646 [Mariannaea sp. PMI_226]|nr:hypothetical protein BGZ63DRAFT_464646 [Mariannaea sp. PMI_226]
MLPLGIATAVLLFSGTQAAVPRVHPRLTQEGNGDIFVDAIAVNTVSAPVNQPGSTNVVVNSGCVLMNGAPRCAAGYKPLRDVYQSFYNVVADPNQGNNTILILSGFDATDDNRADSIPTLMLQAVWPTGFGQVNLGDDGCLYDSNSNKIYDQCSTSIPQDSEYYRPATNPYSAPTRPLPGYWAGNPITSTRCGNIAKDLCVNATQRYIDNVVYREYTSAVTVDENGLGCTVIFNCKSPAGFAAGMTGLQIKQSADLYIYGLEKSPVCGYTQFTSLCEIKLDSCIDCRDRGRDGTLWTVDEINAGGGNHYVFTN